MLLTLLGAYRSAMREFAGMTNLAVWYSHMDVESVVQQLRKTVDKTTVARARGQRRQGSQS